MLGVIPNRPVSSVLVYGWTVISTSPYYMAEVSLESDIAGTGSSVVSIDETRAETQRTMGDGLWVMDYG